jgi:N-acetylglucosamine-6-phosphate deacetylase
MRLGVAAAVVGDTLVSGDVELDDGRIVRYGIAGPAGRGTAVPGFVDLQVNGFADVDFLRADAEGYRRAGAALLETGVTSYLPTLISAPEAELVAALGEVPCDSNGGPRVLGAHVEGPFLSPRRRGVHPASALRDPDPALLERLLAAGPVRLVTLAPELPGADELIDLLAARGVAASIGHTDATATQAHAAFDRGACCVTHLFNAMRPLGHRDPGVVGAALARPDVTVSIILDGYHLAAETVAFVWRAAAGRVALVTDAVAGAGVSDGSYSLGETDVEVADGVARGPNGELAGSVLTMIQAVRNLVELGAQLSEAVNAATVVPAGIIGETSVGRLDAGLPADLVVLDDNLEIEKVFVGGRALVVA